MKKSYLCTIDCSDRNGNEYKRGEIYFLENIKNKDQWNDVFIEITRDMAKQVLNQPDCIIFALNEKGKVILKDAIANQLKNNTFKFSSKEEAQSFYRQNKNLVETFLRK